MCVVLVGATPVFADVDPESGCITPATAEAVRSPRTRAVIPVHIGGWPFDMPGFVSWARPYGIHILEDRAQSHGAPHRRPGAWHLRQLRQLELLPEQDHDHGRHGWHAEHAGC
jgi:dTDP-4-amino-4,6-dideoxygalactose transaminase